MRTPSDATRSASIASASATFRADPVWLPFGRVAMALRSGGVGAGHVPFAVGPMSMGIDREGNETWPTANVAGPVGNPMYASWIVFDTPASRSVQAAVASGEATIALGLD